METLNNQSDNVATECAVKHNVVITANLNPDVLELHLAVNTMTTEIAVAVKQLAKLSNWLVRVANNEDVAYFGLMPDKALCFFPQKIGRMIEMGKFWVIDRQSGEPVFMVYVNTREFVKVFYLSILTCLGFDI